MKASQLLRSFARSGRGAAGSPQPSRPTITEHDAYAVIRDAIAAVLEVPATDITRETRLSEELHADSLALVEIVELVEERLAESWPGLLPADFRLEDAGLEELQTVGDAITYVVTSL